MEQYQQANRRPRGLVLQYVKNMIWCCAINLLTVAIAVRLGLSWDLEALSGWIATLVIV